MKKLIFWGASGQAKVLKDLIKFFNNRLPECELIALFDNNENVKSPFDNIPIYYGKKGFMNWLSDKNGKDINFTVAIGKSGKDRHLIGEYIKSFNLVPITLIHSSAFIADNVKIGSGSQILANSSICVDSTIGESCIINTGAIVDHECKIDDGVHICPGVCLSGLVKVEKYAFIGAGSIILPRVIIGEGSTVGAGSVVTKDVMPYTTVVGNPAKSTRMMRKL